VNIKKANAKKANISKEDAEAMMVKFRKEAGGVAEKNI